MKEIDFKFWQGTSTLPVLEAAGSSHGTARQTPVETGARQRTVAGRVAIRLVPQDADAVDVTAAGAQAVCHGNRHLPDAGTDAGVDVVAGRLHALCITTCDSNRNKQMIM